MAFFPCVEGNVVFDEAPDATTAFFKLRFAGSEGQAYAIGRRFSKSRAIKD
jgi:hypothetical protein